jgi:hypothetical protein
MVDITPAYSRKMSDASGASVKTDSYFSLFHNHRNSPHPIGMLKHLFHLDRIGKNVDVFKLFALFCKSFTSCCGKGSGVFSENKNLIFHSVFLSVEGQRNIPA